MAEHCLVKPPVQAFYCPVSPIGGDAVVLLQSLIAILLHQIHSRQWRRSPGCHIYSNGAT